MKNRSCHKARLLIPLFILAVAALLSLAVYGLWNGVLADVLPVKTISYWQALGLLVLSRILFGGFPGRHRGPFGPGRQMMMKHWESMTPEQREKMREAMQQRFGNCSHAPSTQPKDAGTVQGPVSSGPAVPASE